MKMYVANATRQTVNFVYRLPGQSGLRSHMIPIGKQLLIPFDLDQQDINYIIETNAVYGFIDHKDIDRTKQFIGLCYSVDKPVPSPKIFNIMDHNMNVLQEQGQKNRQLAAVAANNILEDSLNQNKGLAELAGMEMTITEEVKPGRASDDAPLNEGFHVSRSFTKEQSGQKAQRNRQGISSKKK